MLSITLHIVCILVPKVEACILLAASILQDADCHLDCPGLPHLLS